MGIDHLNVANLACFEHLLRRLGPIEMTVEKEVVQEVSVEKPEEEEVVKDVPVEKLDEKEVVKEVPAEKLVTK